LVGKKNKQTTEIIFGKHLKKTQLDVQFIFSIFRQPLHVSGIFIEHHQEAHLMDTTISTNLFQYTPNKMQQYTVYLYLETALHVSGVTSTHHQERI